MQVVLGEIVIIPQGFHFVVNLLDGSSHGYVAEIFGTHFQLPDLGPIGAAKILKVIISCAIIWYLIDYSQLLLCVGAYGLVVPRDFLALVA